MEIVALPVMLIFGLGFGLGLSLRTCLKSLIGLDGEVLGLVIKSFIGSGLALSICP